MYSLTSNVIYIFSCDIIVAEFEPVADFSIFHHMLIYGCSIPGQQTGAYKCGEMMIDKGDKSIQDSLGELKASCEKGVIVYAWAGDAPSLTFPSNVGYHVGKGTPIKYLVLQVHYKKAGMLNKLLDIFISIADLFIIFHNSLESSN